MQTKAWQNFYAPPVKPIKAVWLVEWKTFQGQVVGYSISEYLYLLSVFDSRNSVIWPCPIRCLKRTELDHILRPSGEHRD
jgi:hypothetical protein